jgi:hypothetical protein
VSTADESAQSTHLNVEKCRVLATGAYVPDAVVTNEQLAKRFGATQALDNEASGSGEDPARPGLGRYQFSSIFPDAGLFRCTCFRTPTAARAHQDPNDCLTDVFVTL